MREMQHGDVVIGKPPPTEHLSPCYAAVHNSEAMSEKAGSLI